MIWIETPTNPMLNVIDVSAVAKGKRKGVRLVVDNTFATPVFQSPIDLGADVVVHSVTKYMAGHSDLVGGALATNDEETYQACRFYQNSAGAVPGPLDCFLVQRGLKTLQVRMQRHDENARRVAAFLDSHPAVEAVFFPGLRAHPAHAVAERQMRGYSGMVSFYAKGGREAVDRIVSRFEIFKLAESLGGVESLVCFPTRMTHHAIPESEKAKIGITDALLRLSVGIEDADDLLRDLAHALD
jgi:cystathionine beta-lyase/cystathionine gamma-synthase